LVNPSRVAIFGVLVLVGLAAPRLPAQPGVYKALKLPYRLQWGPYRVAVEEVKRGTEEPYQRVRILDPLGAVLREVQDSQFESVALQEITGGGTPELYLHGYSGGAHCCGMEYYFTRDGGLRNLLVFEGANQEISKVQDLDGDGRPELIAGSDVLAYFGDLPYAASPPLTLVIGWNGSKYADQTRKFPEPVRRQAAIYRAEFMKALPKKDEFAETDRRGAALGYYASLLSIGEEARARTWLMQTAPAATRRWLEENDAEIRRSVAGSARKIRSSQAKVLLPADNL